MQYRRVFIAGGTYFFTIVTFERRKIFASEHNIALFRQTIKNILQQHPFKIDAAVVLPDHIHMIWSLPEDDSDYATRWRLIKSNFTRSWGGANNIPNTHSRQRKGEQAVWQRRYWEHLIRDESDLKRHVEYIHYNPVKHGLVDTPAGWKHSSFQSYVRQGLYPVDWGGSEVMQPGMGME